ncbi:unnamed protein product [Adineta ricciae]|uniref:Uncharacterized protein n=1 Tax=Adineta ricciae TaxID=249248 RepID=A0A816D2Z4_ADIRI|nr:unnamed protein product [Adineta ricciae]CAF1629007.1 unnamed protein product [Adineta ricciae]
MYRLQSYWIATLLIVCLVVDFQPYKVSATPIETTAATETSTTQLDDHKAKLLKYQRMKSFLVPFPPSPFIQPFPDYL